MFSVFVAICNKYHASCLSPRYPKGNAASLSSHGYFQNIFVSWHSTIIEIQQHLLFWILISNRWLLILQDILEQQREELIEQLAELLLNIANEVLINRPLSINRFLAEYLLSRVDKRTLWHLQMETYLGKWRQLKKFYDLFLLSYSCINCNDLFIAMVPKRKLCF